MKRHRPIKRLRDFFYWLKCRLWHRYNVVVCHSLPPTWNDRDQVMFHAAFQCLVNFIEKERPWEFTGDVYEAYKECGDEHVAMRVHDWNEIRELYHWWLGRRDDYRQRDEDDDQLIRLIRVRGCLWT